MTVCVDIQGEEGRGDGGEVGWVGGYNKLRKTDHTGNCQGIGYFSLAF